MTELEEIAEAQVAFRSANELIRASAERLASSRPVPFICECADRGCSEVVRLTIDEYEAIRQHPRRFFNVSGHERPSVEVGAERVVAAAQGLTVVEKLGAAGDAANA